MAGLTVDGWILFVTRTVRLFSYGWLAVALILYLEALGYSQFDVGVLFTCTLLGDTLITLYLTTTADSLGRKNILITGAILKIFAGVMFAFTSQFWALVFAGVVGVISPTGGEIGPFQAVEQAALTASTEAMIEKDHPGDVKKKEKVASRIAMVFAYYNVAGYVAISLGALASGFVIKYGEESLGYSALGAYRIIIIGYGIFGGVLLVLYSLLSSDIEPLMARERDWFGKFGLQEAHSRSVVARLSALFLLDSFAGGFVMQTIIVYWFSTTWKFDPATLGTMLLGANLAAGISAIASAPVVNMIGPIKTMVYTHLPSNVLLLLVPMMPTAGLAVGMLIARFCISQMDVPARQTYINLVVEPHERSAANGITSIVRSVGVSLSPLLVGYLLADPNKSVLFAMPFFIAGGLKIVYDVLLYISFRTSSTAASTEGQTVRYAPVDQQEGAATTEADHPALSTLNVVTVKPTTIN